MQSKLLCVCVYFSLTQTWLTWLETIKMTCRGLSPSAWRSPTGHSGRRASLMRSRPSAGGLNVTQQLRANSGPNIWPNRKYKKQSLGWISTLTTYIVSIFAQGVMKIYLAFILCCVMPSCWSAVKNQGCSELILRIGLKADLVHFNGSVSGKIKLIETS